MFITKMHVRTAQVQLHDICSCLEESKDYVAKETKH